MLKLKLAVIALFFALFGIFLSISPQISTSAKGDFLEEIAEYKNWTRITKEPVKVEIDFSAVGG